MSTNGIATIDLTTSRYASLTPLTGEAELRDAFARFLSLALSGIAVLTKP